jgi:hypothetical protein
VEVHRHDGSEWKRPARLGRVRLSIAQGASDEAQAASVGQKEREPRGWHTGALYTARNSGVCDSAHG